MRNFFVIVFIALFVVCSKADCDVYLQPNNFYRFAHELPFTPAYKTTAFLLLNDMVTNRELTPEIIECFASDSTFSSIGLYLDDSLNLNEKKKADQYISQEVINSFMKVNSARELIVVLIFSTEKTAQEQISRALTPFLPYAQQIDRVWVRTQLDSNCPDPTTYSDCQWPNATYNQKYLNSAFAQVQTLGFNYGLYSTQSIWERWFPTNEQLSVPVMYDGSDCYGKMSPNFSDYSPPIAGVQNPTKKVSCSWLASSKCCWLVNAAWEPKN